MHGEELMAPTTRTRTILALLLAAGTALAGCASTSGGRSANQTAPYGLPGRPTRQGNALPNPTVGGAVDQSGFATEVDPRLRPQSTFAMDVDTASYGYASNPIKQGQPPAPAN